MAKEKRGSRSGSVGSGPGKGVPAGQPPCGLGLGDAFQFPKENLAGGVCTVRRMCGRAAHDHHGYPARVDVELLARTDCVAGCAT